MLLLGLIRFLIILNGCAIDINPLYNPYVAGNNVSPRSGYMYVNRSNDFEHKITKEDALYEIFIKHRLVLGRRLDW